MYQVARGTQDFYGTEVKKWQVVEDLIRQLCYVYGYGEIRTPIFEHTEVFKRGNDSSDMVNKEMYTFEDNGKRSLTLRPEGTAGVVRSFVENKLYGSAEMPVKLYYQGSMFRYERPQKGRYRQFHQFGAECIGLKSPILDAEVIALGCSIVSAIGISQIKVLINTLGDDESRTAYREALKSHFEPHLSELCGDCQRRYEQNPLRLLDCKVDHTHESVKTAPSIHEYLNEESRTYFEEVLLCLDALEIEYILDENLVRGLDYYTHTVFEVISTHEQAGAQATMFAGGRYDGLVEYFGGPSMSGVGFAMGMERLIDFAQQEGITLAEEEGIDCYVMPLSVPCQVMALQVITQLRASGYTAEMDYAGRSMKAQFKSVDRKKAKVVLILGEDELKQGNITIKDIASKTQVTVPIETIVFVIDTFLQAHNEECGEDCGCGHEHEHNHEEGHECQCGSQHSEGQERQCGSDHDEDHECQCGSEHSEEHECCGQCKGE